MDLVYLYELYENYGFTFDKSDEYAMQIYIKYKDTIPYHKKSKDIDYVKIDKMITDSWTNICNWMIKYGQDLWD